MSAIFAERLTFQQDDGSQVELRVFGDEFYARYETADGYTAVYDVGLGLFCYAGLVAGEFVSTGTPITQRPPPGIVRHLEELESIRQEKHEARRLATLPPAQRMALGETFRTLGPNRGLLAGRRLSSGAVRGLTVLVEFQDVRSTVTVNDVDQMLNGANYTANGNFCSAREYFRLVSNAALDYTNDVVGPYRLSRNRSYYTQNLLVKEALDLAQSAGVDFTRYDSRREGFIDALNFLYAGQTQYLGELWPHNAYIDLRYGSVRTNLYLLTSMGRTAADLSIGTFCHENGHLLCRFPDMYDYGNRDGDGVESAGIGAYCLMGSGNHNGNGRTPSPVCAYLRDLVGWCDNQIDLNAAGSRKAVHGDYRTVMKFSTDKANEYFIVENRSKMGLDSALPASGLAVYHCDILGSNEWQEGSATRHYQCALLQADGLRHLERNDNAGDGGDLYGPVPGIAVSHATNPSSRMWDGAESGLIVSDVSAPADEIDFATGGGGGAPAAGEVRGEAKPNLAIPDANPIGVSSAITLAGGGVAQRVRVELDITHTYVGDLRIEVQSPAGRRVILHGQVGGNADDIKTTYDSDAPGSPLRSLVGQSAAGPWLLRVTDLVRVDVGTLNRWAVILTIGQDSAPTPGGAPRSTRSASGARYTPAAHVRPAGTVAALPSPGKYAGVGKGKKEHTKTNAKAGKRTKR
jgi:M6 family metalloprotease-like protein